MKVLHLRSSRGLYGAERVILDLARAVARKGDEVALATFLDQRAPQRALAERAHRVGIDVYEIPVAGRLSPHAVRHLAGLITRGRFTLLHTHDYKSNCYGIAAAKSARIPVVATLHGETRESLAVRLYEFLDLRLLPFFSRIAAVSPLIARKAARAAGEGRVSYIPNGLDFEALDSRGGTLPELPAQGPLIAIVGRLSPEKGHLILLQALACLRDWHQVVPWLAIAGEGPLREEIQAEAKRLGLTEYLRFLGSVEDVAALYQRADLVVLPSLTEGLPMVALEAMALGRPVVASAVGAIPEVIRHGEEGLLVPPGDPKALAVALARILREPALGARLGTRARCRARTAFGAERMMQQYYQQIYLPALRGTLPLEPP